MVNKIKLFMVIFYFLLLLQPFFKPPQKIILNTCINYVIRATYFIFMHSIVICFHKITGKFLLKQLLIKLLKSENRFMGKGYLSIGQILHYFLYYLTTKSYAILPVLKFIHWFNTILKSLIVSSGLYYNWMQLFVSKILHTQY